MFERITTGWELAKQSYQVLKMDKEMLIFPLLSGIACLLVLASFALPLWNSSYVQTIQEQKTAPHDPIAYIILFLFYFCNYFVIIFFNSALISCAIKRFNGGDPTLGDGFRAAADRLPQIFAWAVVSATVGVILKAIESRSEKLGQLVAGLFGMAWGAATYFVVPILVVEKTGPIDAIKRSLAVLRKTWGEALSANFGIGLIVFLAGLVAVIPAAAGVILSAGSHSIFPAAIGIIITIVLIMIISLVSSALHGIVIGALYQYAAGNPLPPQFDKNLLQDAFTKK